MHKLYEFLKLPEGKYIPFFGKYWYFLLCKLENDYIKKAKLPVQVLNNQKRDEKIIVSLTSFPERIETTYLAVKSLMLQDYKPDEIILWLSKEQFNGIELPKELLDLTDKGLQIKYCEDLRGHKKYYELVKNQKQNELILTFDDDIIYPKDSIAKVMKLHKKYPSSIVINRGYEITFDKNGNLEKHLNWKINSKYAVKKPEKLVFISCGSGALFPYKSLNPEVLNSANIKKYILSIDDLWLTLMAIMNDTSIVKTTSRHKTYTTINGSQEFQLALENTQIKNDCVEFDRHDEVLEILKNVYPDLAYLLHCSRK